MKQGIEIVKDLYRLFSEGNIPAVLELLHPEVTWEIIGPSNYPFFGSFKGRSGFKEFLSGLSEATNITNFQPENFIDAGSRVIVTGFEQAEIKHNQVQYKTSWCHVFQVVGEQIVSFEEYLDTASVVQAYEAKRLS